MNTDTDNDDRDPNPYEEMLEREAERAREARVFGLKTPEALQRMYPGRTPQECCILEAVRTNYAAGFASREEADLRLVPFNLTIADIEIV